MNLRNLQCKKCETKGYFVILEDAKKFMKVRCRACGFINVFHK